LFESKFESLKTKFESFVCRATTCEKIWIYNCETKQ